MILTHDHPFLHWDLMLESQGMLLTWRLMSEPAVGEVVAAEQLPDHRIQYLDYEGPVSGDRGTVTQFEAGRFERIDDEALFTVRLLGRELRCSLTVLDGRCKFH